MFVCDNCKVQTKPRDKATKIVVQQREKVYGKRYDQNDRCIDEGGVGWEIVKEIRVGPCCKENLHSFNL